MTARDWIDDPAAAMGRGDSVARLDPAVGLRRGPTYRRPASRCRRSGRRASATPRALALPALVAGLWLAAARCLYRPGEAQNFDLAAAVAQVKEADAQARIAGAALLPSVTGGGDASARRTINTRTATPTAYHEGNLGIDASYELDFWGKNQDTLQAAKQTAFAAGYDQQVIALTVTSGVAMTYFQALALQDRIAVTQDNLAAAEQMLAGIQMQFTSGITTELNISQQQTVVDMLRPRSHRCNCSWRRRRCVGDFARRAAENVKLQAGSC